MRRSVVLLSILIAFPLRAQEGTTARAVRADRAPVIDGRDADAVWKVAPAMSEFRQFEPAENGETAFRTEARVAYDDRNLYVLVRAFDPAPDSIISLLSRRDVKTSSDQIKIIIDAYKDRRSGVEMAVNPAGVKRDFSIYADVIEDPAWDGVWDVAVSIDSLGWIAEFAVPFSQLRFNDLPRHEFGFGIWRDIARRNQRDSWPAYRPSARTLMGQMGTITGIEGIGAPRRVELLPYAVLKSEPRPISIARGNRATAQAGLDAKAGLGSRFTLDATVNPDFGQVEADPAVLNLTAFEIRFDERRPFFQEGAGLYRCGGPCEGTFYTRRIGRTPQLRSTDADPAFTNILGAAKLTGRWGAGNALGVVNAVTERVRGASGSTIEPLTNYFVFRSLREMNQGRAQIGMQLTDVRRQLDDATSPFLRRSATTGVLQGYSRFASNRWEAMAYTGLNQVQGSQRAIALTQRSSVHYYQRPDHEERYDTTRTSLGGYVIGGSLKQVGGKVRYENFLRYSTPGLELNDFGIVPLVNDVSVRQSIDFRQTSPNRLFRSAFSTTSFESHFTTGGLLSAQAMFVHTSASFHNNWGYAITGTFNDIGPTHCVSCARGGPALRQSLKQNWRLDIVGDPRPVFVPRVAYRLGRGDAGRSWSRGADVGGELRVASRFSMSLAGVYDHVVNDQQWVTNAGAIASDTTHYTFARLDQHLLSLTGRANWTATPTLSLQLYAQPFVTSGAYDQWRELAAPRAAQYADRFRTFRTTNPNGFNVKQLNTNAVLRWEYRPGSTMFAVWQQGRFQDTLNPGSFGATRDVGDLFDARPLNTLLVKLSYWFNP